MSQDGTSGLRCPPFCTSTHSPPLEPSPILSSACDNAVLRHRVPIAAALLLLLASLHPVLRPRAQTVAPVRFSALPRTTQEHLRAAAWWPTKPLAAPAGFVGAAVCAECHGEIADSQGGSQMARTLVPAASSPVLRSHLADAYHSGPYTSTLSTTPAGVRLTVTDGHASETALLGWAFGSGEVGQSYLWQSADGSFHEARFNYFESTKSFGDTPGRLDGAPASLPMALGRTIEGFEAETCFRCHTTTLRATEPLDPKTVVAGVHCEACHGPGAAHIAAVRAHPPGTPAASTAWDRAILNPARLSPSQAVDLCGSCHSTAWDVVAMGAAGVQTVRFPAYRLEGSRCWIASGPGGSGDPRLTCFACHDPHSPLDRVPADYDRACLSCHSNNPHLAQAAAPAITQAAGQTLPQPPANRPGKACPVASSRCTTCHMPKFEVPEMHARFTDHRIRIAHAGEPFPDARLPE